MYYFSQFLGLPVCDEDEDEIGTIKDFGIAPGEVFPRVTTLVFEDKDKALHQISWDDNVKDFTTNRISLTKKAENIVDCEQNPEEILLDRDLMDKQIIDTRGMKVVRVHNLKLSSAGNNRLRLIGAVGTPESLMEDVKRKLKSALGKDEDEQVIAWNYIDFLDKNLDSIKLSVSHKTLEELHPADIASIIEQLDPEARAQVFSQLDDECAAEAMAELDEDEAAEIVDDMDEHLASSVLNEMDPDDAADLVSELKVDKAEKLLHLMGVKEQQAVRQLLGYREETAGRIMTSEFVSVLEDATVQDAIDKIRALDDDIETINYVYITDKELHLKGAISVRALIVSTADTKLIDIAETDLIYASPDEDQEDVALSMGKYNLLALPIVDESMRILGIVTADDALDIMEEEHEEDLQIAGAAHGLKQDEEPNAVAAIFSQELWLLFWGIGIIATTIIAGAASRNISAIQAFCMSMILPIALHSASTMIRSVTSYYFNNDPDDEDALPVKSFFTRGIVAAFIFVLVVGCGAIAVTKLLLTPAIMSESLSFAYHAASLLLNGVIAALVSVLVTYLTAPAYVNVLRSRDEQNLDTSGIWLKVIAYSVSIAAFIVVLILL